MSRAELAGKRVAIFGLGRSGLSIARACLDFGAAPVVFDESARTTLAKPEIAAEADSLGVALQLAWDREWPEGIDLIVSNPAIPRDHECLVNAPVEVLSEVEFAYRISLAPIVAITGTNGKSTTTVMTMLALRAAGVDAILCGNIYGSGYDERPLTEAARESTANQVLVAEVSSFQLEWVSQFRPVAAGITTITPDHLNRYGGSLQAYADTKMRIWAAQREEDFAVCRAHDPIVVAPGGEGIQYRKRGRAASPAPAGRPTVLTFGASGESAAIDEVFLTILGHRVRLDTLPFDEPHNIANAACAVLLAYGAISARSGRPRPDVVPALVDGVRAFRGLAHRMERVGERDGVLVINNSMCTNPDAVIKSAQAVRRPTHLIIGGVNKDLDFAPLRNFLKSNRHWAYLFGTDAPELNEMLGGTLPTFAVMADAFRAATERARPDEAIMLAPGCASTDQFRDFVDRGNVFTQLAKDWLSHATPTTC